VCVCACGQVCVHVCMCACVCVCVCARAHVCIAMSEQIILPAKPGLSSRWRGAVEEEEEEEKPKFAGMGSSTTAGDHSGAGKLCSGAPLCLQQKNY